MKFALPFVLTLLTLLTTSSHALDIEKLFMPGDLIWGHQKYQKDCKQCHSRGRDITQNQLCRDCHEDIDEDVKSKEGFHGKNRQVTTTDCRECHADHKGIDANIVWLDKDQFNHEHTDYPLKGKHKQTECKSCHKKDKKYREAQHKCVSCHKEDDVHKEKLGDKCESCHNPKSWSSEQFDHDKTDFKLKHAHQDVACDLCHVENRYKDTPDKCVSCHAIKDVHQNRFGQKCEDCHSEKKWDESIFDHQKDTKFKIRGKHKTVNCNRCHGSKYAQKRQSKNKKVNRSCYSCHRLDDVHKGKNKKKCAQCHNEESWLDSSFDHDRKTKFPLKGAHKKTSCQSCHQSDQKGKKKDRACYSCHKHEDVHKQQQGKQCDDCHNDISWWMENVRFDHELSDFPLIGQHAVVSCEACHPTSAFKDVKKACISCHREDDVHKEAVGTECEQCHNPNDWLIWIFDHDEQTDFKIEGAHQDVHCHRCHFKPLDKENTKRSRCIDCHNGDDVHNGNFGPDCGQCHSQKDFKSFDIRSMINSGRTR